MNQHKPDHPETAEEIIFVANLDEFAARVSLICGLEAGGKLTPAEAYAQIRGLWKQLKRSRKNLGVGKKDSPPRGDADEPHGTDG